MAIQRVFLGWNRPALTAAADYLIERYSAADAIDLSAVILAVPGGRAGRRIEELLLGRAEEARLTLMPPQTITVGQLPEKLYVARRPFADRLTQQLAWIAALDKTDPGHLQSLAAELPDASDLAGRFAMGEMFARLHRELAADGLDFHRVAQCGEDLEEFPERRRWEALAVVQDAYLRTLDELELWDLQTARLYAIEYRECRTECDVILVGTVDLNLAQRMILDQVGDRVTSLIFAPDTISDRFDSHGCLRVPAWQDATMELRDDQIELVDGPADQAAAIVGALAGLDGRFAADEVTIGVPSEALVPYVEQHLAQCGISARYGAGRPIGRSSPCRLLVAAAEYLQSRSFRSLAALMRHPAIHDWLTSQGVGGDWLTEMDEFQAAHLPETIDCGWGGSPKHYPWFSLAHATLSALLESAFDFSSRSARPLSQWGQPILDFLVGVFGSRMLRRDEEPDRTCWVACEKLFQLLSNNLALKRCGALEPSVGAAEALRLVLRQFEGETIAPLPEPGAVELLGWLELPLDDAPALIVCGLNDQTIPDSLNADLFLPDRTRRRLGIEDNDRRYARDLYALSVLIASRKDLKLIAARTSPEGNPLTPSRLLFACDEETVARRALSYFADARSGEPRRILPGSLRPGRERSALQPPRPEPLPQPVLSLRVTEFRDYLACPYRYYLKHRQRLAASSDWSEELDGGAFGSLAHDVLADFAESDLADSTDPDQIALLLGELLNGHVGRRYGKQPLPAVRVQVAQLGLRLQQFARWQAEWVRQGWSIQHAEKDLADRTASLAVDGELIGLRGRIDRIDVNAATGQWAILDYKTSDSGKGPEQTHRRRGEWVDLQLPLYRHLAAALGLQEPVLLGYIVLPKDVTKTGLLSAEWSEQDLDAADAVAAGVVRGIRSGCYWPPTAPPPPFSEEFAAICQDGQFGALADALREEGGATE